MTLQQRCASSSYAACRPYLLHWSMRSITFGRLPAARARIYSTDKSSALTTSTPEIISGHWSEFRRSLAQIIRPELYDRLRVRSLAVNGVISCAHGVLIGRRSSHAVYQAGQWQLPPAGSVDQSAENADGNIDFGGQLLQELREEFGCRPSTSKA